MTFGRAVVTAKLSKQAVLLHRSRRQERHDQVDAAIVGIIRSIDTVAGATSRDEIMGAEGAAARAYFAALGALLPAPLRFATRSRRPPLDVINSALSFGYTLLLGEAVTALTAAGLDPAIGLLHTPADRRPSLARLGLEHGSEETDRAGVLLNREGRAVLIDAYEQRMATVTRSALPGFTGSIRRHLHRQAQRLAAWVERDVPWDGLEWR
ncbi:CRISPR-associated endonuclease Cas1 [Micromonospora sp. LOL_021]|uniref:CRISPR-associated endonuclease Cas1 n=1 Tax=Micromonospora sp. LOL_021 TaxID=3345417 RepID=UPI003A8B152D